MDQGVWTRLDLQKLVNYVQNVNGKIVLGIDGIIDEVWQVVESRISRDECVVFNKMKSFGELIVQRGSGGMANELLKKRRICGGFTANTGRAVGSLGITTTMVGMYGKNTIDPIYDEFKDKCSLVSIGNPALCNILEFTDGKIMMTYLKELLDFTWQDFNSILGDEKLKQIFDGADIVTLGYWANMPAFDELVVNIHQHYLANNNTKRLFFDFANIKKRSQEAFKQSLQVLSGINNKTPVTLSLNEHEAVILFEYYDKELNQNPEAVAQTATILRKEINLDEIVIHTPDYAVAASQNEGTSIVIQDHCPNPVKTAGAGDTFNGGYMASSLGDLNLSERLAIANATTNFYVSNGFTPDRLQLIDTLKRIKQKFA